MEYLLEALGAAALLVIGLDREVYYVVWTSISITVVAVALASVASIPLGIITAVKSFTGKRLLLQTLNTLMAVPTVVIGLLLYGLLSRRGLLGDFGLLYTPAAIVIGQCLLIVPIIWNLTINAVSAIDPRLPQTCRALGATQSQQIALFLREARFGIMAALVMGFGRALSEVGIAMMLGGNIEGFTRTMTTAIALETSKGEFELALALGILLLACAFIVNGILQRLQRSAV